MCNEQFLVSLKPFNPYPFPPWSLEVLTICPELWLTKAHIVIEEQRAGMSLLSLSYSLIMVHVGSCLTHGEQSDSSGMTVQGHKGGVEEALLLSSASSWCQQGPVSRGHICRSALQTQRGWSWPVIHFVNFPQSYRQTQAASSSPSMSATVPQMTAGIVDLRVPPTATQLSGPPPVIPASLVYHVPLHRQKSTNPAHPTFRPLKQQPPHNKDLTTQSTPQNSHCPSFSSH